MERNILEGTSLREVDAVLLEAECLEGMEDTVCGKSRVEVSITVRQVLQAGGLRCVLRSKQFRSNKQYGKGWRFAEIADLPQRGICEITCGVS